MKIYKVGDKVHRNTVDPGNVTQFEDPDTSLGYLTKLGEDQWAWGYENESDFCGAASWNSTAGRAWNTYLIVAKVEEAPETTVRARVLEEAKRITATDRNSSYGEPEDNFQRIADFWNTFLGPKLKDGAKISAGDTAALMIMVKLAREMNAPKEDNKVDGAGYFACWAEVDFRA
jgi:hypothetical protein